LTNSHDDDDDDVIFYESLHKNNLASGCHGWCVTCTCRMKSWAAKL